MKSEWKIRVHCTRLFRNLLPPESFVHYFCSGIYPIRNCSFIISIPKSIPFGIVGFLFIFRCLLFIFLRLFFPMLIVSRFCSGTCPFRSQLFFVFVLSPIAMTIMYVIFLYHDLFAFIVFEIIKLFYLFY